MEHAIREAQSSRVGRRISLFEGTLGVAAAAARVGTIIGNLGLLQAARILTRIRRPKHRNDNEFDLIGGKAGAICCFILLARVWRDRRLIDRAAFLGRELLHSARRKDGGCSWGPPDSLHLTGFSHGAAGAAYALIELYRATGDDRYISGAKNAFKYERRWYDPDVRNWRDFRELRGHSTTTALNAPCACHWCHGAPGIALSRLRALEVLAGHNRASDTKEALDALHTTRAMVEAALYSAASNFCLCHGLAGNAEILMEGSRVLGERFAVGKKLAWQVARVGADRHADHSDQWPCGLGSGTTPGLMCGLSGIGYFYIRLHNPSVPSVLMPRPECW
jgi:lantibiotic biosynthesis protein